METLDLCVTSPASLKKPLFKNTYILFVSSVAASWSYVINVAARVVLLVEISAGHMT